MEWWRRIWAKKKLERGRCANCTTVLRDDATDRFCSDDCAEEYLNRTSW